LLIVGGRQLSLDEEIFDVGGQLEWVAVSNDDVGNFPRFKCAKLIGKSKDLLLKVEAPEYAKTPFLGAVIQRGFSLTTGKGGKRAGTAASASSAASGSTNPNQPPSSVPNSFDPSGSNAPPRRRDDESEVERSSNFKAEASIWTFDPRHNRITGSFVNPDKKPVTVALHYNPHSPPGVDLVSDVHAYKAANPKSFAITVEFVSH